MTESIVASDGASIPAPLAIPKIRTPKYSFSKYLALESVVMIASAIFSAPSRESEETAISIPGKSFSMGKRTPMSPVEQTTTSPAFMESFPAKTSAVLWVSANPSGPVQAFAPPLLRITAEISLSATTCRDHVTGAATTLLEVKTAVPYLYGPSFTIRARSGAPELLIPTATPEPLNPCGRFAI